MMKSISDLEFKTSYHKGEDDIAKDFYLPCMAQARQYDRAVGFFRSSIYLIAWGSLSEFVSNGGTMRIICSPVMDSDDADAIEEGYSARTDNGTGEALRQEITEMLDSPSLSKPTKVLAGLVAEGIIEFKIATIGEDAAPRHQRLFHDKVGIFRGDQTPGSDAVVFKGSMNETWAGLSMDGNLESVDVYLSWGNEREQERVEDEISYFNDLWSNEYSGDVTVRDFPDVARDELVSAADDTDWRPLLDEIVEDIEAEKSRSPDTGPNPRTPLPHQQDALDQWEDRGRRGILEHATGSGKTFTALCAIREALKRDETPVIFVPSTDLLSQWKKELKTTNQDLDPDVLICGDDNTRWRRNSLLRDWTRASEETRIVLSTMQTGRTSTFRALLSGGDHIFIIADEVHRIGSPENQKLLRIESGPRLGLSATPRRAGDPDGTDAIMQYFEGIVQPPFTLTDAINAKRLTPYYYHIHTTGLTPDEREDWLELSKDISSRYARLASNDESNIWESESLKHLLIQRANIVKQARNKIELAYNVIREHYEPGHRWLVYCSDLEQLSAVCQRLRAADYNVLEYHSKMDGNREQTIRYFERNGGIIVSIKCLDEGVDIPNATHALILASSKNPREFIQRRGRVLRKSDNKHFAQIHDAVVVPDGIEGDDDTPVGNILRGELARSIQFAEDAVSARSVADLKEIAVEAGIDYKQVAEDGFESDDNDD